MNLLQCLIEPLLVASVKMPVNVFGVELASNRENLVFGEMCRIVDDFRADVAAKAAIQELLTLFGILVRKQQPSILIPAAGKVVVVPQVARWVSFKGVKCRLDYNSTKVCFAYFGFSPGRAPDKTKVQVRF